MITHTFSGNHPLGGTRHYIEAMRRWFQRLYVISPQLNFTIKTIIVSGWPWDTSIAVEWEDRAVLADSPDYVNEGIHIIKMCWGKVAYLHAHLDTQINGSSLSTVSGLGDYRSHCSTHYGLKCLVNRFRPAVKMILLLSLTMGRINNDKPDLIRNKSKLEHDW
jgi:ketosteroid isomerase-like protein